MARIRPNLVMLVALALTAAAATNAATQPAAPPAAAGDVLPPGAARDMTMRVCATCHPPALIVRQHRDRAGWAEVVELMAARGAMASQAELDRITDYLAKNFPAAATPAPKG